jgi:site-specific DNA-cytosine methylase
LYYFGYDLKVAGGNVPQNRERIYVVGFLDHAVADKFYFPDPILLSRTLIDVIDFENKKEDKYYYSEDSCKFYDKLKESINRSDTNEYILPEKVSNTQLYKQAGNSVVVPVIQRIAEKILIALGEKRQSKDLALNKY